MIPCWPAVATPHPRSASACALVVGAFGCGALLLLAGHYAEHRVGPCGLEQSWSAGDVYHNEELTFSRRGRGDWYQGDRHGEEQRLSFSWRRRRATLTIRAEGETRALHARIDRRGDTCVLRLDRPPLARSSYREFYGAARR
jgi:hypothetical protein